MTRDSNQTRPNAGLIDRTLFILLTALLCVRPLISEAFASASFSFLPDAVGSVSPTTTVWLDAALMLVSAAAWTRRPPRKLLTPVGIGFILLLAAVILSAAFADSKRVALNAAANLFVLAWAAGALSRVMCSKRMINILLAALIAAGVANAAKCISQRVDEFDATLESWTNQKTQLQAAGVDVTAPDIVNFERRIKSGETFGYLSHSNVAAACMTTAFILAIALAFAAATNQKLDLNRRSAALLLTLILAAALAVGVYFTGSMGAFVSGAVALLLMILLRLAWKWAAEHQRPLFAILIGSYIAAVSLGAAYGLIKNTLPNVSLAFRWQYWRAAAAIYADHPWTGVGRENFRTAYLLQKTAESTEEVANAHNLWLTLASETGAFGLIAGVTLLGLAFRRSIKSLEAQGSPPAEPGQQTLPWLTALAFLALQAGFHSLPLSDPNILLLWGVYVAGVWIAAFFMSKTILDQTIESTRSTAWLSAALIAAFSAILIHNLIGFSLFTPAGLSVLAVLAAVAYAWSGPEQQNPPVKKLTVKLTAINAVILAAAYIACVAWPTIRTHQRLQHLKASLALAPNDAAAFSILDDAYGQYDPSRTHWDASLPVWAAGVSLHLAHQHPITSKTYTRWLVLASAWSAEAERCEPLSFPHARRHAQITRLLAEAMNDETLLQNAETLWRLIAIPKHPTDVHARIEAADLEYQLWKSTTAPPYAAHAMHNYSIAIEIDSLRPAAVAHKLSADEARRIAARLNELRQADR